MLPTALRKAAILIAALDERAADALLEQMGAEQAAKVRSALMELEQIPVEEERQVLAEFMQRQNSPAVAAAIARSAEDGVELDLSMPEAEPPPPHDPAEGFGPGSVSRSVREPLATLQDVPPGDLAAVLYSEQPQMIAAVLSSLTAEQTAAILQHLPSYLATDVLERLAVVEPLAPAVLADLEQELLRRMARRVEHSPSAAQATARLNAVLGAMDFRQRQRVLLQLSQRNTALAARLGGPRSAYGPVATEAYGVTQFRYRLERTASTPRTEPPAAAPAHTSQPESPPQRIAFDDLAQLDDASLRKLFASAEPRLLLIALTGADQPLLERIYRQLSTRAAAQLRQQLDHPGPVRLREIEQAHQQLAILAGRLASEGLIRWPRTARFATSA